MPTPRKYATNAERQASYRTRCTATTRSVPPTRVPSVMGPRRWAVLLEHAQGLLTGVAEEMATYRDERSEAWQDSERGEQFTDRLAALEEILDAFGEIAVEA